MFNTQLQRKPGFSPSNSEVGKLSQFQRTQPSKSPSPSMAGVTRAQQSDWEKEIESLDQKEMELHQTQMKLIREQMTNFIRDISGLREEFKEMCLQRESDVMQTQALHEEENRDKQDMQSEIMAMIQALQEDFKGHTGKLDQVAAVVADTTLEDRMNQSHSELENRIALLHQSHGETTQLYGKELAALREAHDSHADLFAGHAKQFATLQATIPERLAYLEQLVGDSADAHTDKLEAAMAKFGHLHGRLSSCEQNHDLLAQDKDVKHASLQERVDYLESAMGDSADKHAQEIEALKAAHDGHVGLLSKNAQFLDDHKGAMAGHHGTLQERMDEIENVLGLHADKHGDGLAEAASNMEQMHTRLSAVERFGGVLEELGRSHSSLAREKQELADQHSGLQDRFDSMDKAFGDSFSKHGSDLQALGSAHDKHLTALSKHARELEALRAEKQAIHDSLSGRLDSFEQLHGETADKHAMGLSQLDSRYQAMLDRLTGVEKHGGHISNLQRSHDTLAAKKAELEDSHASMGDRVSYLEQMLGDSVEKHAKELRALRDSHSKHANDLDGLKSAHSTKHSSVDERLDYIEQVVGDSADKHAEELAQLKSFHDSLHGRLTACEGHGSVLNELRDGHGSLAAQKAQLEQHHASLKERVDYLEGLMNDSADRHAAKIDAAHGKLTDMHSRLSAVERFGPAILDLKKGHSELHDHKSSITSDHTALKDRTDNMEALFGDSTNRQTRDLKALKALHDKHATTLTNHASQLDGFTLHQEHHASLPERMTYIEQQIGDSADKHLAEISELHKKVAREQASREKSHNSYKDQMAREQEERGNHHASMNERLDYLESVIGDNADKHASEIASVVSGHQKLYGELGSHGNNHASTAERVSKLEKAAVDVAQRQEREGRATQAKLDVMAKRFSIVKEAWGLETPRPS